VDERQSLRVRPQLVRWYTGLTIEIRNSGLVDSLVCGYRGEAFFDQQLIPLGFPRTFARWERSGDHESGIHERNGDVSRLGALSK
jgi:hypothetical protein